jgi:leucyl-tRNA synthetase
MIRDDDPELQAHIIKRPEATPATTSSGLSKPVTRAQKLAMRQVEPEKPQENDSVRGSVEEAILQVHEAFNQKEESQALELAEQILPRFISHRSAQSPERVAALVTQYAEEAVGHLAPLFPGFGEEINAVCTTVADRFSAELLSR